MTRLIGLDVGTSSTKGVAIDQTGAVLAVAERGHRLSTPRPGWSEQDPDDWWGAAVGVLEELDASGASGIGLSGQMHGLVALDTADRPLRPAILWNDGRTQKQCDEIEARVGRERLIELTGNRALAGFTAPKLLWMREEEPDNYERIRSILLPKDYVRLRLCDEHAIDVADASGTLLFDVAQRRWSDEVLDALEIDRAWLPRVAESPDVAGETHGGAPVGRRARRRRRRGGRSGIDRARHLGRRVRRARPLRGRPRRAAPRLLSRGAGRVARHGRDALGRRVAALAARHARRRRGL
jgi:xylulokinase